MNKGRILLAGAILLAACTALVSCARAANAGQPETAAEASSAAADPMVMDGPDMINPDAVSENMMTDSYRHLTGLLGDFMYSPYSLKDAFRILYPASEGKSRQQMDILFGFGDGETEKLDRTDREMVFRDGIGVKSVNRAFVNESGAKGGLYHPEVLGTDQVDIRMFGPSTADEINAWIAENTENRVTDLIPKGAVTEESGAVLVNCLYFLLNWKAEEGTILWNGKEEIPAFRGEADLMNIKEDGPVDILRLPYIPADPDSAEEHRYSMVVICDREENTADKVDLWMNSKSDKELLQWADFSGYGGLSGYSEGSYVVPCFEMKTAVSLRTVLEGQGLTAPFDPASQDFSGFGPLVIDDVLQGTFIRCDEKGTEAAAATAIIMNETALPEEPVVKWVIADSTFAFLIVDETAGEILFQGRVANPEYTRE